MMEENSIPLSSKNSSLHAARLAQGAGLGPMPRLEKGSELEARVMSQLDDGRYVVELLSARAGGSDTRLAVPLGGARMVLDSAVPLPIGGVVLLVVREGGERPVLQVVDRVTPHGRAAAPVPLPDGRPAVFEPTRLKLLAWLPPGAEKEALLLRPGMRLSIAVSPEGAVSLVLPWEATEFPVAALPPELLSALQALPPDVRSYLLLQDATLLQKVALFPPEALSGEQGVAAPLEGLMELPLSQAGEGAPRASLFPPGEMIEVRVLASVADHILVETPSGPVELSVPARAGARQPALPYEVPMPALPHEAHALLAGVIETEHASQEGAPPALSFPAKAMPVDALIREAGLLPSEPVRRAAAAHLAEGLPPTRANIQILLSAASSSIPSMARPEAEESGLRPFLVEAAAYALARDIPIIPPLLRGMAAVLSPPEEGLSGQIQHALAALQEAADALAVREIAPAGGPLPRTVALAEPALESASLAEMAREESLVFRDSALKAPLASPEVELEPPSVPSETALETSLVSPGRTPPPPSPPAALAMPAPDAHVADDLAPPARSTVESGAFLAEETEAAHPEALSTFSVPGSEGRASQPVLPEPPLPGQDPRNILFEARALVEGISVPMAEENSEAALAGFLRDFASPPLQAALQRIESVVARILTTTPALERMNTLIEAAHQWLKAMPRSPAAAATAADASLKTEPSPAPSLAEPPEGALSQERRPPAASLAQKPEGAPLQAERPSATAPATMGRPPAGDAAPAGGLLEARLPGGTASLPLPLYSAAPLSASLEGGFWAFSTGERELMEALLNLPDDPRIVERIEARLSILRAEGVKRLLSLLEAREEALLRSDPVLARLASAHEAVRALHEQSLAYKAENLAGAQKEPGVFVAEVPFRLAGELGHGRLEVSCRTAKGRSATRAWSSRVVLDLHTSRLGPVLGEMRFTPSRLDVDLATEGEETVAALGAEGDALRAALEEKGFHPRLRFSVIPPEETDEEKAPAERPPPIPTPTPGEGERHIDLKA
ncbi:MAG: hypothetical protein V1918_02415 [Planctomycetota bacterium]